jgi:peptide-methionine (S)-S-oxide reductase
MSTRSHVVRIAGVMIGLSLLGCRPDGAAAAFAQPPTTQPSAQGQPLASPPPAGMEVAIFAGGCFWCMEGPFERIEGVIEVLSGYTGGERPHPTYAEVASGATGHTEAVRVVYDPAVVDYERLLEAYWRAMDPTDAGGQFADRGSPYRPALFVTSEAQRVAAEASKAALAASGRFEAPIVVPIVEAGDFWVAEDYHQDYYRTNASHYERYREGSGRAGFLRRVWGDEAGH